MNSAAAPAKIVPFPEYFDFAQTDVVTAAQNRITRGFSLGDSKVPNDSSKVPFLLRLRRALDQAKANNYDHIIDWQPHGRAFLIRNRNEFATLIMPFFFKDMTRYESFLRQLNYYGFLRINHGKSGGPDNGAYYHECFLQGRPDLVAIMPRLIKSESSVRRTFDPTTAPNLSALSPIAMDPSSLEAKSSTMTESSSHLSSAETTVVIDNPLPLVRRQCTQYPSADSVWDPLPLDSIFLPNDGGQAKVKVAAVPRQSAQTSKVKDSRNALWPLDQQCIPRDGEPFKSSLPPPPLDCPFGSDATPAIPVAGESTMEYATQSRSRSTAASSKRATDTYLEGMSNKRQYNPSLAYDMASDPWYHELVRLNCYNSNTESIESTAPLRCLPLTWDKRPYTRLHDSTASMARISCEHRAQEELKEFLRGVPSHFWEY